ncbi:MAG: hypothetical protein ABF826_11595 [Komagataeibacter saccharivorans]|uniref:ATP-grasp domain-containing protein n=1 Tax=Novacetimonas pomaceti TaxID=2021998 RepID=A0ABX5NY37_9PROT|nr:hypothetical protein [Novacetimonas pomaceti]PYD46427.1 hypothetical protein C3920_15180 [Novacetimonas pomaceti]
MMKPQRSTNYACSHHAGNACSFGAMEQLPKPVLCIPLVLQWLWLGLRYRSLTLPSVVNPAIETGGLAGESKAACLARIGQAHAPWVARTVLVSPADIPAAASMARTLGYPLVAKPDIGWCGHGVRRIDVVDGLTAYIAAFPPDASFLLQEFVPGPFEAGLFYSRGPTEAHGRLIGLAIRHSPQVTGDGVRSIAALMAADPRLCSRIGHYRRALSTRGIDHVPMRGERVILGTVASLRVGGRYEDAMRLNTPALEDRVDAIARSMHGFHFGRLDVRFGSEATLQRGEFRIIEINGAGSEAIQFWDPTMRLRDAYRGVFAKQAALFALAARMRADGAVPISAMALATAWWRQLRLMRRYPSSN